jgi:hypothetical protein
VANLWRLRPWLGQRHCCALRLSACEAVVSCSQNYLVEVRAGSADSSKGASSRKSIDVFALRASFY